MSEEAQYEINSLCSLILIMRCDIRQGKDRFTNKWLLWADSF